MSGTQSWRPLLIVLSLAFGLRLAAAGAVHAYALAHSPDGFLFGDSHSYWVLGDRLARGQTYRYGSDQGRVWRMPGYPLFLAAVLRPCQALWPVSPEAPVGSTTNSHLHQLVVRGCQAVVGVVAVLLVYWLGRAIRGESIGIVAAALAAVYPVFVVFSVVVLSEIVFVALLLAGLLAWLKLWRETRAGELETTVRPKSRTLFLAALTGGLWGLGTLVRGSWLAAGVLFVPWYLLAGRTEGQSTGHVLVRRLPIAVVVVMGFGLTMAPWWVRNWSVTGHFVPTTLTVGASLYDGWNEQATGASDLSFLLPVKQMGLDEYEQDRWLQEEALRFARHHPDRVLELAGIKFLRFWNIWPNAEELQAWPMRLVVATTYLPVLALGLWGGWVFRRDRAVVMLLLIPLVYLCLLHMVFVGSLRYRLPGMYPFMVLSAAGLLSVTGERRSSPSQRRTREVYKWLWRRYGQPVPEQDRATFYAKTGFGPEDLRGRRVLDAGCGSGRYLRVTAQAGARIVGIDLSDAIFCAREATSDCDGVQLIQGDLLCPPVAPGSFDSIFAIGVLEHTPDPPAAFRQLIGLLKPGGRIVVWLHPKWRPALEAINCLQRAITSRMPLGWLARLCRWAVPIGGLKRWLVHHRWWAVRRLGVLLHAMTLGVSLHPDPRVRVCDTFNWYAPRWRRHHTREEVWRWFEQGGLTEVRDLTPHPPEYPEGQGAGINLSGRRPV